MATDLEQLRASLTGDVLGPDDREYERARLCFNLLVDRRPVAIVRCVDADDVAKALLGGTGKYAGADGTVTSVRRSDESYEHTFEIED